MDKRATVSQSVSMVTEKLHRAFLDVFGRLSYKRFAVVGHSRTGSNYLFVGLSTSNRVKMYHEVFAERNRKMVGREFDEIFPMIFRNESRNIKAVGFKLFYEHLTANEWEKFLSHDYIEIIHLTRRNRLRTIASLDIAFKTDQWSLSVNDRDGRPVEKRILLDTSTLIHRMEGIREYEAFIRDRFRDRPIIEVVYENLIREPGRTFNDIGAFLGVDDFDLGKITLAKQNPENLDELIANYDEVYGLLKDTIYEPYMNS